MANPMEPLQALGRELRELAEIHGARVDEFLAMPDENMIQVAFVLPPAPVDIDAEAARLLEQIDEYERERVEEDGTAR